MVAVAEFGTERLKEVRIIDPNSHKGDNGKVLVIGGSTLFHSASIWAAELAAHFVDHVFYYSPAHINKEVLLKNKTRFRNGFMVNAHDLEEYAREADVILIGPGLRRQDRRQKHDHAAYTKRIGEIEKLSDESLITYYLVNSLIGKFPGKKWVVDAGALQEIELDTVSPSCILTPHQQEFGRLFPEHHKLKTYSEGRILSALKNVAQSVPATWLLKRNGTDYVVGPQKSLLKVVGGNEGLIKGGTGDLLAALAAVLYVKNPAMIAAAAASFLLKKAAESLYLRTGPYYTTTQLLQEIPQTLWQTMPKNRV